MYVEVGQVTEGNLQLLVRIWEDGRAEGQPRMVQAVVQCRRADPVTGEIAMRGPGLVRRIASCFDTGYTLCRVSVAEVAVLPQERPTRPG
jgi:hypothetical protein